MAYYLDFVGLNTFIYEPVGYNPDDQGETESVTYLDGAAYGRIYLNYIGIMGVNNNTPIPGELPAYKNFLFPYNLSTTASFFPALMLHRNGPYGWPTWKQIRIGENPLTRKQNTENVFTIIEEPGSEVTFKMNGQQHTLMSKYGSILKYDETPVTSKFKPIKIGAGSQVLTTEGQTVLEKFELQAPYANETIFFNNDGLSKRYDKLPKKTKEYEKLTGFYLNGALNSDRSPLDTFQYFKYAETVYPPQIYAWKNYVRQRTTFVFPWRDSRDDRKEELSDQGFGSIVTQSIWQVDAYSGWDTLPLTTDRRWQYVYGYPQNDDGVGDADFGILQNQYNFGSYYMRTNLAVPGNVDGLLKIAPLYNRKHTLSPSSSVVSPNGMRIEGINTGTTMNNIASYHNPGGEAKWEAGSQSGLNPFYDSYDDYVQGVRQRGKGYTIVPEFRISNHIPAIVAEGVDKKFSNMFEMTGGLSTADGSDESNFYKVYSTSDFLKHFDLIREDHKGFLDPVRI